MTWVVWRQHRAEAIALTAMVAAVAVALFVLGQPMHGLFPQGATRCAEPPLDASCRIAVTELQSYGWVTPMLILLNLVPFAIGAFVGAPLLARDLEAGTWQLAWTQSVPRHRWLGAQLVGTTALVALLAGAFSAVVGWFHQPLDLFGRFEIDGFDVTGVVPVVYALFAFALAGVAGMVIRRSLPALAASLVLYVAVRVAVAGWLRPHYEAPLTLTAPVAPGQIAEYPPLVAPRDWTLSEGFVDAAGNHPGTIAVSGMANTAERAGHDPGAYLAGLGIRRWAVYQPMERYWPFQLIESALFAGLTIALLAAVAWRVRRRPF